MFIARRPLLLASASPRRQEFLAQLGLAFTIRSADIDETPLADEPPEAFALRMARTKAEQFALAHPEACVIAADPVVALDRVIFGKPRDPQDALAILQALRGRTHEVITGFALLCPALALSETHAVTSQVSCAAFADEVLQAYVESGEPMDKAGAYGIQGRGAFLVQHLSGSYSNVVGLPLSHLVQLLLRHDLIAPRH